MVDDHPTFCAGIRSLIEQVDELTVCAEAPDTATAMQLLAADLPDLMLVDINLKQSSGFVLTERARQEYPTLRILVTSMYDESLYGERAINAGANGYINKQEDPEKLIKAMRLVSEGDMFVSRALANRMLERRSTARAIDSNHPETILSERELEIFTLIGSGYSTKEIAVRLSLSPKTVDTHRDHVKKKIGARDNVRLVHRAVEWVISQRT